MSTKDNSDSQQLLALHSGICISVPSARPSCRESCLHFPKSRATSPLHPQGMQGAGVGEWWHTQQDPVMKEVLLLLQEVNAVGLDFPFLLLAVSN